MKKLFFISLLALAFTACDYSTKSNGNIDEAFSHDAPVEPKEMPHADLHTEEKTVEAVPAVQDSLIQATDSLTSEPKH
jgi:outer membrane lipopolysaccharide assembly protein LptE/RlpB